MGGFGISALESLEFGVGFRVAGVGLMGFGISGLRGAGLGCEVSAWWVSGVGFLVAGSEVEV